MATTIVKILVTFVISAFAVGRYRLTMGKLYKEKYPNGEKRFPLKELAKVAGLVIGANIVVSALTCTKPTAIVGLILAVAYYGYIAVAILTSPIPRQIRSLNGFSFPMAVNVMFCRIALASGNYEHPWKTVKSFFWFFVIPIIVMFVVSFMRYAKVKGWFDLAQYDEYDGYDDYGEYDDPEPETASEDSEEEVEASEDGYYEDEVFYDSGNYDDYYSYEPWHKRVNWVAVICTVALIVTFVTCLTIILLKGGGKI